MSAELEILRDSHGRALNLAEPALTAARTLRREFPRLVFTSGRRTREEQASAMAANVLKNSRWIEQTYRATVVSEALQAWVNAHNDRTLRGVAQGLAGVLARFRDDELTLLSKHFSGLAFDVQPVGGAPGEAMKRRFKTLPGLVKFLDREGGLIRWHLQFA